VRTKKEGRYNKKRSRGSDNVYELKPGHGQLSLSTRPNTHPSMHYSTSYPT
jgi:hypothetical protein